MTSPTLHQIESANQLPLNQAAMKFLKNPKGLTEIAALALMRWGLENGIEIPSGPGRLAPEEFEYLLVTLGKMPPEEATAWIQTPEDCPEDVYPEIEALSEEVSPDTAAWTLIDTAYCKLEALS